LEAESAGGGKAASRLPDTRHASEQHAARLGGAVHTRARPRAVFGVSVRQRFYRRGNRAGKGADSIAGKDCGWLAPCQGLAGRHDISRHPERNAAVPGAHVIERAANTAGMALAASARAGIAWYRLSNRAVDCFWAPG